MSKCQNDSCFFSICEWKSEILWKSGDKEEAGTGGLQAAEAGE